MMQYNTIANDGNTIKLSVGIDIKTQKPFMPSLTFTEVKDPEYPTQDLYWDNPDLIFETLKEFLDRFIGDRVITEDFKELSGYLDNDIAEELIEIIDKAKELGWYVK